MTHGPSQLEGLLWGSGTWFQEGEEELLFHRVHCRPQGLERTTLLKSSNWRQVQRPLHSHILSVCSFVYLWRTQILFVGALITKCSCIIYFCPILSIWITFFFCPGLENVSLFSILGAVIFHLFSVNLLSWLIHWEWTQNYKKKYRLFISANHFLKQILESSLLNFDQIISSSVRTREIAQMFRDKQRWLPLITSPAEALWYPVKVNGYHSKWHRQDQGNDGLRYRESTSKWGSILLPSDRPRTSTNNWRRLY